MDQATNGLNATTTTKSNTYDLACRYNNLFQYNPAMAAAAAAAAYGLFNKNNNNNSNGNNVSNNGIMNGSNKTDHDDEVEEEADERREAEDSGDAAGQHRHRRPAEVQRLVVVHHVPRVDGHHSWDHDHFERWLLQR